MQPALSTRIQDGFMAAMRLGGEKPHQGLPGRNPAPNPVREVCKFTVLLGMRGQAELNRAGSCCTGKERDAESGNDYFGARYYASTMGRFMSPDWSAKIAPVPYAMLDNPQSLNLYAYMRNNPLGGVDADGHGPGDPPCDEVKVEQRVEQPTHKQNERLPDGRLVTGVTGNITDTITVHGQVQIGVQVSEFNKETTTVGSVTKQTTPIQDKGTTNLDGAVGDKVGPSFPTDGTVRMNSMIDTTLGSNNFTIADSQTLKLTFPQGGVCYAQMPDRTVSNIGQDGKPSLTFKMIPDKPPIVTAQPTKPKGVPNF